MTRGKCLKIRISLQHIRGKCLGEVRILPEHTRGKYLGEIILPEDTRGKCLGEVRMPCSISSSLEITENYIITFCMFFFFWYEYI
jgi:hypothetical protein